MEPLQTWWATELYPSKDEDTFGVAGDFEVVRAADAQAAIAALQVQCELWKERAEAHEEDHLIINGLKEQVEALQAQHKYLCRFVWGEEGTFTFPDGDTIEIRKGQSREQLEQQLTQRTAELHETQNHLADADNEVEQLRKQLSERTAELEAVSNFIGVQYDAESRTWVSGQAPYQSAGTTKQEACIAAVDALRLACATWETKYRDLQAELERVRGELAEVAVLTKEIKDEFDGCMHECERCGESDPMITFDIWNQTP